MAGFNPQPDEGYSEDPLTALSAGASFSLKQREDAVSVLGSVRSRDEFPPWLVQHISSLSIARKTGKSRHAPRAASRAWDLFAFFCA
jgi:F-box and WD-40 domain protein 1/11